MKAILLLGPTASGKTAVALALAERLPVEIVSVDSAQVYRGMDIGTAKASAAERAAVPHHLIDIATPSEPPYSGRRPQPVSASKKERMARQRIRRRYSPAGRERQ